METEKGKELREKQGLFLGAGPQQVGKVRTEAANSQRRGGRGNQATESEPVEKGCVPKARTVLRSRDKGCRHGRGAVAPLLTGQAQHCPWDSCPKAGAFCPCNKDFRVHPLCV